MSWEKPTPATLFDAIDAYLARAYEGHQPPATVKTRVQSLRELRSETLYGSPAFEAEPKGEPTKLSLRLGNRVYPHMKLVVERTPEGRGCLFRADTHDRHIQPAPGSRDDEAFRAMMEQNQRIAAAIESEWEARGLPTFKQYLRQDLARRREAQR